MRLTLSFILAAFALAQAWVPTEAQDKPATVKWLDFDAEDAALPTAENCTVTRDKNGASGACLAIKLPEKMEKVGRVTFELPADLDVLNAGALTCSLRATPTAEALSLRWLAESADGATLLQRRLSFDEVERLVRAVGAVVGQTEPDRPDQREDVDGEQEEHRRPDEEPGDGPVRQAARPFAPARRGGREIAGAGLVSHDAMSLPER
jgi:hypothetical protein